ncbi:MAG TPA: hypothetical protein PKM73_03745 [Verrucomicrobiota bacterium]|nr:hypothetical protein [Verrucomicrobiota bacterium]HNU50826.1 hypothetical protein [Verrucomicrobiota bacterium]
MSSNQQPAPRSEGRTAPHEEGGDGLPTHWLFTTLNTPLLGVPVGMDVYLRNAYRLLGLPANAPAEAAVREMGRLKSMARLSANAPQRFWIRNGYESRLSCEEAMTAVARLKDPRQRLIQELFWPHLDNGLGTRLTQSRTLDDPQLRSELHAVAEHQNGRAAALARHGLAILYHNLALRDELLAGEDGADWSDQHWRQALTIWGETLANSHFWEYMADRVRGYDDFRVQAEDLEAIKPQLWRVILEFHSVLARSHAERQPTLANGHLRLLSTAPCPSETMVPVLGASLKAIAGKKLVPVVAQAQSQLLGHKPPLKWQDFRSRCEPILQQAGQVLAFLAHELRIAAEVVALAEFDTFCDVVATGLAQSIDYSQDRERALLYSMVTTRRLLGFPLSSAARIKHESILRQDRQMLYHKEFALPEEVDPTECWFLAGEPADPDACIVKPVYRITRVTAANIQWNQRRILVPRSTAANEMHRGRKPPAGWTAQGNTPAARALNEQLEAARAKAAKAEQDLEAQRDAARRQVQDQYARRLDEAQQAIDAALARVAPQVAAAAAEKDRQIAEENTRLESQLGSIQTASADELAAAQQALDAITSGQSGRRIPWALLLGLGATGAVLGAAAGYALDFWYLLPRSVPSPMALAGGACVGSVLCGSSAAFSRTLKTHGAERRVGRIRKRLDAALAQAREDSARTAARIQEDSGAALARIEAEVTARRKARQEIEASMQSELAAIDATIQTQQDAVRKDAAKRVKKLEDKLAALVTPKKESAASDFPPYRNARAAGYRDGERPSDAEAQAMMTEEFNRLVQSLTPQQAVLLQVMLQQAGPGQQAAVLERFIEMRGGF